MKYDEFDKILNQLPAEDYIVTIASKHQKNDDWTIHNEILTFELQGYADGPTYVWLNDWYEGQEFVEYLGISSIDAVVTLCLGLYKNHSDIAEHLDIKERFIKEIYLEEVKDENND